MDGDGLLCSTRVLFSMNVHPERRKIPMRHSKGSPGKLKMIKPANRNGGGGLLGLRLLGDILDGEALLADNCSHVLGRHDDAKVLL